MSDAGGNWKTAFTDENLGDTQAIRDEADCWAEGLDATVQGVTVRPAE